jgi:hypothetical protein
VPGAHAGRLGEALYGAGRGQETVMSMWPSSYERLGSMHPGGRADARTLRYARRWSRIFGSVLLARRWLTLELPGRRPGRVMRFPLGMADWNGQWYLVPMLGEHCNLVRELSLVDS